MSLEPKAKYNDILLKQDKLICNSFNPDIRECFSMKMNTPLFAAIGIAIALALVAAAVIESIELSQQAYAVGQENHPSDLTVTLGLAHADPRSANRGP